jgi:hypothetical protein
MLSGAHQARQHSRNGSNFFAPALQRHLRGHVRKKMSIPENWIRVASSKSSHSVDIPSDKPESREDSIRRDLTLRLKHSCEHLSHVDFETLISDMTREQLRGEGILGRRIRPR